MVYEEALKNRRNVNMAGYEYETLLIDDWGLSLEERSDRHPDHKEAARSFLEKRTPEYNGTI